jgi:hypothetical protein
LSARRWLGLGALLGALAAYYVVAAHLWNASTWWDVAFVAFVLFPAVFGLVWLALPLRRAKELHLLAVGAGAAAIAVALQAADQTAFASFFKLAAATAVAFWMLRYFESVVWIALVAFIIPLVDIYSVFWGPTSHLIKHPGGVSAFSFAFRFPGEHNYATLGVPDLLFFALFMAAAARFGLRVAATWFSMIVLLGATIALTVWRDVSGLPALPALSLGFLVANCDRIWRSARELGLGIPEPD